MHYRLQRNKKNRGFTLVEGLLVVLLISLFAGLISPRLASFYKASQFDSSVRAIMAVIDYAQVRAALDKTYMCVRFDRDEQSYQLERQVRNDRGVAVFEPLAGRFGKTRMLPSHVVCEIAGDPVLYINPDGSVAKKRIVVTWDDRRSVEIQLQGYFGDPSVKEVVR